MKREVNRLPTGRAEDLYGLTQGLDPVLVEAAIKELAMVTGTSPEEEPLGNWRGSREARPSVDGGRLPIGDRSPSGNQQRLPNYGRRHEGGGGFKKLPDADGNGRRSPGRELQVFSGGRRACRGRARADSPVGLCHLGC